MRFKKGKFLIVSSPNIEETYKNIPPNPGVYLMKNDKDKIIYVGKAKNLKKRVSSYFNREHEDNKTRELLHNSVVIDDFFDNVMINSENQEVKHNRLEMLSRLMKLIDSIVSI